MQLVKNYIDLLLVADYTNRAALLCQVMQTHGFSGVIRRVDQNETALACIDQNDPNNNVSRPDLILFDFSEPHARNLSLLKKLLFAPKHSRAVIILLTSPSSEQLLETGIVDGGKTTIFAPTSLTSFFGKMREHPRQRFLRALSVMSDIGPILVRLPGSFMLKQDSRNTHNQYYCRNQSLAPADRA